MLKFEFWSIFEAVANVLILFVLLRIFLFKPINKMKAERTRTRAQRNYQEVSGGG